MTTRKEIIEISKKWLGTPFEHQGRSIHGIDCAGYIQETAAGFGHIPEDLPRVPTYGRDPDSTMELILDKYLIRRKMTDRLAGSILFFGFGRKGQHLGILSESLETFFHAYELEHKVVETRLDQKWQKRLRGIYDFPGVID